MKKLLTGNEAAALAAMMAGPQVIAAYPITPQTSIAENLADYAARKLFHTKYFNVESETSALAACIGGSLSGARTFTATSSQGIALMHELLYWAAGARLPIMLVNVNRSMASPWSLGVDHNDSLSQRDTGCIQIYCETAQEVLDTVLIGFKLAETALLPIIVCMDGFLLSHYTEAVEVPDQETVDRFLPPRQAEYVMDPEKPCTYGGGVSAEVLYELRQRMQEDMELVLSQYRTICDEFKSHFGRVYGPLEIGQTDDSRLALITNGTLAGTVKAFIKQQGPDARLGHIKLRLARPFPKAEVRQALSGFEQAIVIDRNLSPGSGGIFAQEIRSAMYEEDRRIPVFSALGGLGGVDVAPRHLEQLVARVNKGTVTPAENIWMEQ